MTVIFDIFEKGDKTDFITMDDIYDMFIDTGYYADLRDKMKY